MNEFYFERKPWEVTVDALHKGDVLSAARLIALLEGEDDSEAEAAMQELQQKHVSLDIRDLPKDYGAGQTEARLRREEKLAEDGLLLTELEENDPLRLYLEEIASTCAAGDPQLLAERYAAGEEAVVSQLVNVTISRAIDTARKMTGRGVLLLDLIQEASLGLWQGILHYECGDFDAHVQWWIEQYVAKAVTMQARAGGLGQKMRKALEAYRDADRHLLTQLGRNPTLEEIALELGISPEEAEVYEEMLRTARTMEQIKKPPVEDEQEEQRAVEDTAYFQSRQRILDMLSTLSETEARVLTLRFGLDGGLPATPEATAAKLDLTARQVVQLEAAALAKLRANG